MTAVAIIAIVVMTITIDGAAVVSIIAIMVTKIAIEGVAIDLAPPTTAVVDRTLAIVVVVMAALVEVLVKAGLD
jgi:hypothetical protein